MATGELDFEELFGFSYDRVQRRNRMLTFFPQSANFLWIIFLVAVPILLSNMLVSRIIPYRRKCFCEENFKDGSEKIHAGNLSAAHFQFLKKYPHTNLHAINYGNRAS